MTSTAGKKTAVLFVCTGNICRSPTAEAVFRNVVREAGLEQEVHIESAGTHGYHIGHPPDDRAQAHAKGRGYDLSTLRARQVRASDFNQFDLVLAMDRANLTALNRVCPAGQRHKLKLFLEYAQGRSEDEVPDPYNGGDGAFVQVLDMIEDAAGGLLLELRKNHQGGGGGAGEP